MKITISFTNIKHYDVSNIHWWVWTFKRFIHTKGFQLRLFGINVICIEKNATEKLIAKFKFIRKT